MKETDVKGHTRSRKGKGNSSVRKHRRGYLAGKGIKATRSKHGGVTFKGDKWPPVHSGMSIERLLAYKARIQKEFNNVATGKNIANPTHMRFINKRLLQVNKLLASKKNAK